ncbi:MAG: selenocysteine-specific translation elongation factor [Candidatus Marinimicrobia bacterium]|nr:selenocysteine-specific translation elongation factor [Candidatus Neomarinimicrobiota bacterium]
MKPVIIGTAGHIDHGKSTLLKALTGTDPDRLEEEQRRGLTIDIGFAFLSENIAFIDVPGHERFIKNMVTGASTIDMAMLVIAADDGVMPQTREHLYILQLLGIRSGMIVITKTDLVPDDWLELVIEDIKKFIKGTFLEKARIFTVSSVTGKGIEKLKEGILSLSSRFQRKEATGLFRLSIDRVFTLKGYGTIVTGSVISGKITVGDVIEIQPLGKKVRVRGIQSHNHVVDSITAGHRAALNLQGIEKRSIKRGYSVCTPGYYLHTNLLTCKISLLPSAPALKYNSRIRIHLGTGEYIARVRLIGMDKLELGESAIAQITFDDKVSAGFRDRFIMRFYSPLSTIGGGIVLDINPKPLKKKQVDAIVMIQNLIDGDINTCIEWFFQKSNLQIVSKSNLARKLSLPLINISENLRILESQKKIIQISEGYISTTTSTQIKEKMLNTLSKYHKENPLAYGMEKLELFKQIDVIGPIGNWILDTLKNSRKIKIQGDRISLYDFQPELTDKQEETLNKLENELLKGGFNPPSYEELFSNISIPEDELQRLITLLVNQRQIIIFEKNIIFHKDIVNKGKKLIKGLLKKKGNATVSELKDVLGTSRKWAIPLLNYYDKIGLTMRVGDLRRLI